MHACVKFFDYFLPKGKFNMSQRKSKIIAQRKHKVMEHVLCDGTQYLCKSVFSKLNFFTEKNETKCFTYRVESERASVRRRKAFIAKVGVRVGGVPRHVLSVGAVAHCTRLKRKIYRFRRRKSYIIAVKPS